MTTDSKIAAEAEAFDRRIEERVAAGFVPDLRRAVDCDYFYKSFWRRPEFVDLYLGELARTHQELLAGHVGAELRILDVGCGAGYLSLELARAGHHVTGIDLSATCIRVANETLAENPYRDGFGSLTYRNIAFDEADGIHDVVMFCGCLHHMDDPEQAIVPSLRLLTPGGHVLLTEPCHEQWRHDDAAQVALIRSLLSLTGFWFDPAETREACGSGAALDRYIEQVHREYVLERDADEPGGQSPNDNASGGAAILAAARRHLVEIEWRPTVSFIYRLLGGLRGPREVVTRIATLLATYDRLGVERGFLRPNGFVFLGRKGVTAS